MQAEIVRGTDINKFGLAMKLAGLDLPISHDRANVGTLLDANGNGFAVVDVNRELSDATVTDIAELIVLAVNGRAGTPRQHRSLQSAGVDRVSSSIQKRGRSRLGNDDARHDAHWWPHRERSAKARHSGHPAGFSRHRLPHMGRHHVLLCILECHEHLARHLSAVRGWRARKHPSRRS